MVSDYFLPISTLVCWPASALLAFVVVVDGDYGMGYVSDGHLLHQSPVTVVLFSHNITL